MELRRVGDVLMCSSQSLLTTFIKPSASIRSCQRPLQSLCAFQTSRTTSIALSSRRHLTTTRQSLQQAPARKPLPEDDQPSEPTTEEVTKQIDSLINSSPSRWDASSSFDDALATYRSSRFGADFSPLPGTHTHRSSSLDFNRMTFPSNNSITQADTPPPAVPLTIKPDWPRLNATTGRSIELDPAKGRDLVRGMAQLGMLLARNKVRHDFNMQRFHERPGLKRKRLKSQRWRKRFKEGFKSVVGRVATLTKKGW